MHAVSHASRSVPPEYLLPPEHSLGTYVVIDDGGEVQKKLTEKMALASRQAKASKDYSPLWEGVINLPTPSQSMTAEHQCQIVKEWCEQYEAITGHKVLRADVHLDEGFVDANGKAQFNAHAHVMCDRTDVAGKVIKLSPKQLREVQGMTAEVTKLERGQDARKTGRKRLNHHQYRFLAEQNRAKSDQTKEQYNTLFDHQHEALKAERQKVKDLQAELADEKAKNQELKALAEQYRIDRETLKATGTATQQDYQALKVQYEAAKAETVHAKAQAAAMQQQLQKTIEVANKNRDIGLSYKAKLEDAQEEAREAKEGERLFHDELKWTTNELIKAEQKLYKLEKAQTQPNPQAPPEKTLGERISASFEAMIEWIKTHGGNLKTLNKQSGLCIGPIKHMDTHHCVQALGRGDYCIHQISDLDRAPRTDVRLEEIHYRGGFGHVKPQREQGMDFDR